MTTRLIAAVSLAAVFFAGAAQLARSQSSEHAYTRPGYLRFANAGEPHSLNPILISNTEEDELAALYDDLLVGTDDHGKLFPQLAEQVPSMANGGISRDGRSITFHLRRNVKWHDGAPFTSKDVLFSWQAVMNPANDVLSRGGYDLIQRIETPDPYTAVFRLKHPYGPALVSFFSGGQTVRLIPEHLLAKYPNLNKVDFNQKPIGTGPFKVVGWNRGQSVEFEANDDYFLGKPKLRHISYRFVPSTTTIGITLKTHENDLGQLDSATYCDLKNSPEVVTQLSNYYAFIALQLNTARGPLQDVNVRRAVAHSIDRKALIQRATCGTGTLANGDIAPLSWAFAPDIPGYDFDPKKAAALLDAAGWKAGPDGLRTKGGARLELDYAEGAGGTTGRLLDTAIQAMLHDVGITATIRPYSPSLLFNPPQDGGIITAGKFDLYLGGEVSSADPDNSTIYMTKYFPPDGQNFSRFSNRELDALEDRALTSYDQNVRKPIYHRIEAIVATELPYVYLYYPKARFGMSPDLKGFTPNGVTTTWNAYQWSI